MPEALGERKPPQPSETTDYANVMIENLGQVAFDQAFDLLDSAPREALTAWAKRLETLPVGPRRTAGVNAFFKILAQIDAKTAVDLALTMERYETRWAAIGAISSAAPAANLGEVARMYTALNEKKLGILDLVINWSRSDPVATAQFLSSYSGEVENTDVAQLVTNWAALDPTRATEWLATRPERHDAAVHAGFYSGWLEHDRAAALNDLRTRVNDGAFNKALEVVTKDLFKEAEAEASAFILTLPPAAQETAVASIVGDVTAVYLRGAPELQADQVAKWLIMLPEKLWQGQVGEIMNSWPEQNQIQRDAWIDQLLPDTRDAVLADYCRAYRPHAPADNLRAGLRIRDSNLREETLRKIFSDMEEETRQEILANASLTQGETEQLVAILTKP